MIVLRLVYAANLPDPSDLLRRLKDVQQTDIDTYTRTPVLDSENGGSGMRAVSGAHTLTQAYVSPENVQRDVQPINSPISLTTMEEIVALFESRGELLLANQLYKDIACVKLENGRFEFVARDTAPPELAGKIRGFLSEWTGNSWMVSLVSRDDAAMTLAEIARKQEAEALHAIRSHKDIKAVLETFPGTEISRIYNPEEEEA